LYPEEAKISITLTHKALIFAVTTAYSLFYQAVAESLIVVNPPVVGGCNGSLASFIICNGYRVTAAGLWLLFLGEVSQSSSLC
jgi:hypothetical protein